MLNLTRVRMCLCFCLSLCLLPRVCVCVSYMLVWPCACTHTSMRLYYTSCINAHGCTRAQIYANVCTSNVSVSCHRMCIHVNVCTRVRMHVCLLDVQPVRRGRRSCWRARSTGRVRRDQPMRTTWPGRTRTVAASLPSFTLSASTCSVPFWWVQWDREGFHSIFF